MIAITVVFVVITCYELSYLIRRNRKPRTFWITGSFIAAAYLYLMIIYHYKDLPSMSRVIENIFNY